MNQTIAVIMSATVVVMSAFLVLSAGTNILSDFGDEADQKEEERCKFQRQQVIEGETIDESKLGAMSEDCKKVDGEAGEKILGGTMPSLP